MAGSVAQSSIVEQGGLATVVRRPGRSLAGTSPIPVSMGRSSGPPYRCLPSQAARTAGCWPGRTTSPPYHSNRRRAGAAGRQRATRKSPDTRCTIARFQDRPMPEVGIVSGTCPMKWARIACHGALSRCREDGFRSAAVVRRRVGRGAPIRGISSTGGGDGAGRRVGDQAGSHGQLLALMAQRFGVDAGRGAGPISFAHVAAGRTNS